MQISTRFNGKTLLSATAASAFSVLLAGCGLGGSNSAVSTIASGSPSTHGSGQPGIIAGKVRGGQNPISGSVLQLYAVGATGYTAGLAKPLIPLSAQTTSVNSVYIANGGSGYTSTPNITFSGGGGSGAAATAVLTGGSVTSVTVTNSGSGYTSAPTVTFDAAPNGGTTATGSALNVGSGNAVTDANGGFELPSYTCPSGSFVYLTASGGNPGSGQNNPAIALMAALGSCSYVLANAANEDVNMDEVTTIAGAYALAQFSLSSNFGTPLSSQPGAAGSTAPAVNLTTSSTNTQGVANAMAIANVLANVATGASPGNNLNGTATPEFWQVNTLANMLSTCVNSTGSASCSTLFSNVNIPAGTNPTTGKAYVAPADTLQAALYMALNPTLTQTQISNLYGLITANGAAFNPYASSAANVYDLSLAVAYNPVIPGTTTGVVAQPSSVSFDKYGNAWVSSQSTTASVPEYIVELDPTGNPIGAGTPAAGTAVLSSGGVASVTITIPGSGYAVTPLVTFAAPPAGGTTATGTAVLTSGAVSSVTITSAGSGYTTVPTVTFTPNYQINSYLVAGNPQPFTGWYTSVGGATALVGTFDTNNNYWVPDRVNDGVMIISGSGAAFTSGGYVTTTNGGNANDAGGKGASGYGIGTSATGGYCSDCNTIRPSSIVVDGNDNVYVATAAGTAGATTNSCATGEGNSATLTYAAGLITFVGGSGTNINYGREIGNPYYMALAPAVLDYAGGNSIPGSPFLYTLGFDDGGNAAGSSLPSTYAGLLNQYYTNTGGVNVDGATISAAGCYTPLTAPLTGASSYTPVGITSTVGTTPNTTIAGALPAGANTAQVTVVPALTGDTTVNAAYFMANPVNLAIDYTGNLWISNKGEDDSTSASATGGALAGFVKTSLTKLTPNYGGASGAFTPASAAANFTYTVYHDIGSLSSSADIYPNFLAIDGGGNIWYTMPGTGSTAGSISANGTGFSPAYNAAIGTKIIGFEGSVCPATAVCKFTGTTATYTRSGSPSRLAIDGSGNVWIPQNSVNAPADGIIVLVGPAVPIATPNSVAASNSLLYQKP